MNNTVILKKITLLAFTFFITVCQAQQKAVTESGEEVILNENGTWEFADKKDTVAAAEIKTNPKEFKKSANASFLLKSSRCKIGVWLDPKKWKFEKAENNDAAEFEIQLKGQDLYGMIISEKIEIPLATLKTLAVQNAKQAASDVKIVNEEYRIVNGVKMLQMQMTGTMQGIKFVYFGYYYSGPVGTVQFLTYTSQNLLSSYVKDMEELLGGMVTIE